MVLVRNFPRQSPLSANPLQYDVPAFCEVWNRLGFRSWDAGIVVLRFRPRCHYALAMMIFFNSKVSCLADYRRNLRRKGFAGIHCVLSMMFRSFR